MEQVLRAYALSGQSIREFCAREGIAAHVLRYWVKRGEKRAKDLAPVSSRGFSELRIGKSVRGFPLVLPHGLRLGIEGMAPRELASLVLELDRQQDA